MYTNSDILFVKRNHHIAACIAGIGFFAIGGSIVYAMALFFEETIGRTWGLAILTLPSLVVSLSPLIGYEWYMNNAKQKHCATNGHIFRGENHVKYCRTCGTRNMNDKELMEFLKTES
jgi:hypothetical protein